ncbi:Conserved_hypothetical protein [Hexamita inflata]|uniref:Uncharacterized protein n=1 Tax=Hexamita inflata TaxID=28002 RepID=A0AA86R3N5_9EUKA|nr:Conserved hypothetical protein [Hexamita inflata]
MNELYKELENISSESDNKKQLLYVRNNIKQDAIRTIVYKYFLDLVELLKQGSTFVIQLLANFFADQVDFKKLEPQITTQNNIIHWQSQILTTDVSTFTPNATSAFYILANNLILQLQPTNDYAEDILQISDQIFSVLSTDCQLKIIENEFIITQMIFQTGIDILSTVKIDAEIKLSKQFILAINSYFSRVFEMNFPFKEIEIPNVEKPSKQDFNIEIMGLEQHTEIELTQISRYITKDQLAFFNQQAQYIQQQLVEKNYLLEDIEQVCYIIQILDQYTSIEPSPWKNKVLCEILYAPLAYILHYQFKFTAHNRGRFKIFFGHTIPKICISMLKLVSQLSENTPCAWDLVRIFGLLQLIAIGYLGDGESPAAKEVCTLGLKWNCDYCPENIAVLKKMVGK